MLSSILGTLVNSVSILFIFIKVLKVPRYCKILIWETVMGYIEMLETLQYFLNLLSKCTVVFKNKIKLV